MHQTTRFRATSQLARLRKVFRDSLAAQTSDAGRPTGRRRRGAPNKNAIIDHMRKPQGYRRIRGDIMTANPAHLTANQPQDERCVETPPPTASTGVSTADRRQAPMDRHRAYMQLNAPRVHGLQNIVLHLSVECLRKFGQ